MANWSTGLQVSRWAKQLAYEVGKEIYFSKFMGESFDSMIVKKQMDEGKGKDITFGLAGLTPAADDTSGGFYTGDTAIEGNEASLSSNSQTVSTAHRRFAVISDGNFADSKVLYDFRTEALSELKRSYAEDHDAQIFNALTAESGTFGQLKAAAAGSTYGNSDGEATLAATGKITLSDISKLKRIAMLGGSGTWKMRPIKVDGKDYYVLLIHPEVSYDLFNLPGFQQIQREANLRGDENPLFAGALGMYDGVVIHEHEGVATGDFGSGDAVKGARNLFLGAGAGLCAGIGEMNWVEKTFDYGNKLGIAAGQIYGVSRAVFNSKDYGTIQYLTSRTDI
jgi:N4-gp56 family major capsid protein